MENAEILKIVPLASALLDVWLDFFDARAFSDNPEWRHCYCTFFHKSGPDGGEAGPRMTNRKRAIRLIEEGRMRGYLALEEGERAMARKRLKP